MFFKKKKENKVTKDQIRVVEEIQYIDEIIRMFRDDYQHLDWLGWNKRCNFDYGFFYNNIEYEEIIEQHIKKRIKELENKKMKLIAGDDE